MDASKDQKKKVDVLEAMHYTVSAWQQVMQQTIKYCFKKTGYRRGQPSDVNDVAMRNEDDDGAFHHDWQKVSDMDNEKFDDYVSVHSHLATSSDHTVQEPRESHVGALSMEREDSEPKPEAVSNFAEAHEVFMKVKSFIYAHRTSDGDCDSVLSSERSFFEFRCKVSKKNCQLQSFIFTRISSFNEVLYHAIAKKQRSLNFSYL
jgi:hypothetical protein